MRSLPFARWAVGIVILLFSANVLAQAVGERLLPPSKTAAAADGAKDRLARLPKGLRLATFDVDATPPVGSAMAYDSVKRLSEMTLRCRGVVLLGAQQPIVLCAVDWIGIANEGHDAFRAACGPRVTPPPKTPPCGPSRSA